MPKRQPDAHGALCYSLQLGCVNMWHRDQQRSTTYCVCYVTLPCLNCPLCYRELLRLGMFLQVLTASLIAASAWLLAVVLLTLARLRPPRLTEIRALYVLKRMTPQDLGLPFEPRSFIVHRANGKSLHLATWMVHHPEAAGRMVVIVHGYADAKIGSAAWLPMLHRQKVNVLLLDLPGHGESDAAISTAGWREREDLAQVVDQLRSGSPAEAQQIVLFGLSMGASVAGCAACLRDSIAGVIMDSPFADFRTATLLHARLFGLPGAIVQHAANWLTSWLLDADFGAIAPMNLVETIPCPVLLVQSGADQLISPADQREMEHRVRTRGTRDGISGALTVPDAAHLLAVSTMPQEYERVLGEFLARVMPRVTQVQR